MSRSLSRRFFFFLILAVSLPGLAFPASGFGAMEYPFVRMWPSPLQPWLFAAEGVSVDSQGYHYIVDTMTCRVIKFNQEGMFVTQWGTKGAAEGEFDGPTGIVVSTDGTVFVADTWNHRIQKFDANGNHLLSWGTEGDADGTFQSPKGIALDRDGNVLVTDSQNHRVQKFTPSGQFMDQWGSEGEGADQLRNPTGIAVAPSGSIWVVDGGNGRMLKYSENGGFLLEVAIQGFGGDPSSPLQGIAASPEGDLYVSDAEERHILKFDRSGSRLATFAIQRPCRGLAVTPEGEIAAAHLFGLEQFTSEGEWLAYWGNIGREPGRFHFPMDVSTDPFGNLFVADAANHRIQKFTDNGVFLDSWGEFGEGDGQFNLAHWMAISPSGHLYASTGFESNYRIQKFDLNGNFIASWGGDGNGAGQFDGIGGLASDAAGNIYVSDFNHRIQKFDGNGTFLTAWGTEGDGDGQFRNPQDIVVNSLGEIYVVDGDNHRVQRFTSTGQFLGSFGALGGESGQLNNPRGITVDGADQVYVADMGNHRICIFSAAGEFQAAIGGSGSGTGPGMFVHPHCVTVDASGRIFVSDSDNHRIQVFQKTVVPDSHPKAIIVAGGGAFHGNTIWEATEMCANFAYRTLLHQGYTRDTIHYLSENTSLDVDGNGIADDVDAPATNAHFQQAVTQWATDASDLLIYMADHGGFGTFRMSETELLDSTAFDVWLDALQQTLPGDLLMVYDACLSGSFLPALIPPEGKERYLIASAASDQEAILARGGTISFSYFFWMSLFNGDTVYNAFQHAKTMTESAIGQAPQMDTNGNGVGNEPEDFFIAQSISLGNQNAFGSDLPSFTAMTDRTLNGEPGTSLYVENMVDANGISRVWALIIPPIYSDGVRETPVTTLPAVSLFSRDGERYESEYKGFFQPGAYRVTFYADDLYGARSLPKTTTIVQSVAPDVRGDVNLKDGVTLADAILVLQTLAGKYTRPELAADVNGDGRIGLEEAGFILQKVAGAR